MIKIKSYKVPQQGIRATSVTLPKVWVDDLQLTLGDTIDLYRDEQDRLILIANKVGEPWGKVKVKIASQMLEDNQC